jgi:hypothetical protein
MRWLITPTDEFVGVWIPWVSGFLGCLDSFWIPSGFLLDSFTYLGTSRGQERRHDRKARHADRPHAADPSRPRPS